MGEENQENSNMNFWQMKLDYGPGRESFVKDQWDQYIFMLVVWTNSQKSVMKTCYGISKTTCGVGSLIEVFMVVLWTYI